MSRIRGAVIGIGGIGKHHGKFQLDTGRVDLVGVCDANPKAKEVADKEFAGVPFYTSIEQMLAKEKPTLVSIATPHNLHAPQAIQCLKAGAAVVVEKPMATTYVDAQAMVKAAKETGKSLTVYHNRRFDPWYLAAKSAIDDGLIGNVFEINTGIGYSGRSPTWRGDKIASGGVLFDWGAHLVDYSVHLAKSEVTSVSGWLYTKPGTDPKLNEDHGQVTINFASGARALVTVSGLVFDELQRFKILGDKGTISDPWHWGDDGKLKISTRLAGGDHAKIEVNYRAWKSQQWYDNVAAHVLDGVPLHISAESAARNINILCTAERSHKQGGTALPLST